MQKGSLEGYPKGVTPNKTGLYHFYTIGFIALKMRKSGVPLKYAATLPFVINEQYERVFDFVDLKNPIDIEDVFTGYAGVKFALSSDKGRYSGVDYEEFKREYLRDRASSVTRFFKKDFGVQNFCSR